MIATPSRTLPPCASKPEVYQDEQLLSPPSRSGASAEEWREFQRKRAAAHRRCAGCEVFVECLYWAVVEVDVSGFLACTSEGERRRIRQALGITGPARGAITDAPRSGTGPVDHETVMAARQAHPNETTRQLAQRLGCSMSTVKRHLRREREGTARRTKQQLKPTSNQVLDAFDQLSTSRSA